MGKFNPQVDRSGSWSHKSGRVLLDTCSREPFCISVTGPDHSEDEDSPVGRDARMSPGPSSISVEREMGPLEAK